MRSFNDNYRTGVFRKGIDGVDVSAVTVHPAGALVAASYRNGDVRVYRYPCQSQQVRAIQRAIYG